MVRDTGVKKNTENLKFLCSYGGKIILPRSTEGNLRYVGGHTRVFTVDCSVSYAELMVKLGEFCGYSVSLRCQFPNGDLDTLISIKSDEDLTNLIEEYNRAAPASKIRAVLSPPASLKQISPPTSIDFSATKLPFAAVDRRFDSRPLPSTAFRYPVPGKACYYPSYLQSNQRFLYSGYCH